MNPPDPKKIAELYRLTDWLDDFEFLSASPAVARPELAPAILQERMYRRYPDDSRADERARRLLAAFNFVAQHIDALDAGGAAVLGQAGDLLSNPLSATLYRIFMSLRLEDLDAEVDVAWVLREVEEQRKFMEQHPDGPAI